MELEVNESDLREYFLRFNTKVRASHLYAETREESELLLARLKTGESFEELAEEVFETPYMQKNGGDVGFFSTDDMDISFEEAAFTNPPGSIVGPIQTAQGFSIIKVTHTKSLTNEVISNVNCRVMHVKLKNCMNERFEICEVRY